MFLLHKFGVRPKLNRLATVNLKRRDSIFSLNVLAELFETFVHYNWNSDQVWPRSRSISRRVYPWTVPRRARQTIIRSLPSIVKEANTHTGEIQVVCSTTRVLKQLVGFNATLSNLYPFSWLTPEGRGNLQRSFCRLFSNQFRSHASARGQEFWNKKQFASIYNLTTVILQSHLYRVESSKNQILVGCDKIIKDFCVSGIFQIIFRTYYPLFEWIKFVHGRKQTPDVSKTGAVDFSINKYFQEDFCTFQTQYLSVFPGRKRSRKSICRWIQVFVLSASLSHKLASFFEFFRPGFPIFNGKSGDDLRYVRHENLSNIWRCCRTIFSTRHLTLICT